MPKLNHVHDWEHLGGASFGMYRCKVCFCFGYREGRKFLADWNYKKRGTKGWINPYRCSICKARAVAKVPVGKRKDRKEWRCTHHKGSTLKRDRSKAKFNA